ncbi:MAG: nuclear transport factor 2 family protein [Deltaproteobacteria bacterium]|nr:nuclear transport factor 2 family protein [Deltaproteobacteria bacterium]MBW2359432.1 nuclear transport factor 2 family protein [Deltaproteobacteria bacterium]
MTLSLQEVSDRIEIQDLFTRYTRAIDTQDWNLLDSIFTADAHIDYTAAGGIKGAYPEIREWLGKAIASFSYTMHFTGNSTVELDGDTARSRTYCINPMGFTNSDGSTHVFTVYVHYVDRLVRTDFGWRIAERTEEDLFMDGTLPAELEIPQ